MKYFIAFLLLFSPTVPLFAQSQDNWSLLQKKLPLPDAINGRKCLLINENGFYVGRTGTYSSSGYSSAKTVGIEQYETGTNFKKVWGASFVSIAGMCSDSFGNIYAFDRGSAQVKKFDSEGNLIKSWGSAGSGQGQFSTSESYLISNGITCDSENNVYVVDSANYRIQKFDSNGAFLLSFGASGRLPGQFPSMPSAVNALPDGTILVSAPGPPGPFATFNSSDTQTFLPNGQLMNVTSGRGEHNPYSFQCVSSDGQVASEADFVTGGTRIQIYDRHRNLVTSFFTPDQVIRGGAFDRDGNLWLCRGPSVVCLERRYRFGSYVPRKILPLPQVTNVSQPPNAPVVDIDYRVMDRDSPTVSTGLVAFIGGTRSWQYLVVPKTFTSGTLGLLGAGVPTGTGTLRVTWNAAADMPGKTTENLAIEALAKDDRPELGVRFVTIPADASNPQPLKVSSRAVQENDLWDVYLWMLSQQDPRIAVSGNTVTFTTSGQSYIAGAPLPIIGGTSATVVHNGTVATRQGRALVYKMMNFRPITQTEITRVQSGSYNISEVTGNSVVPLAP
jgi:hypothetical protein